MIQNNVPMLTPRDFYLTQRFQMQGGQLSADYMGATEFETGGVQNQLRILGGTALDMSLLEADMVLISKDEALRVPVHVLHTPEVEIPSSLTLGHTKESLYLSRNYFNGTPMPEHRRARAWLPIQFAMISYGSKPPLTRGRSAIFFLPESEVEAEVRRLIHVWSGHVIEARAKSR